MSLLGPFKKLGKNITRFLAIYGAWVFSSILAVYVTLKTWEAINEIYVVLRLNPWGFAATRGWSIFALSLPLLVAILFLESYYRKGDEKGLLRERLLRVTLVELAVRALPIVVLDIITTVAVS